MENITYEQAMKRLEEIVEKLESNEVSLDESIDLFQEGMNLTKICNKKIEGIEKKVAKIMNDGQLEDIKEDDLGE
ncbi:MAG: exodeoxyribonuclease VII small subunit [Thomasclavelia sp.]|jgi:exodeoxyribonuclease VII small subunit|nr:exodeoxyribonuclease VII small subunit [Thomasclavelia sp.]